MQPVEVRRLMIYHFRAKLAFRGLRSHLYCYNEEPQCELQVAADVAHESLFVCCG
jgi:hypothetical protein